MADKHEPLSDEQLADYRRWADDARRVNTFWSGSYSWAVSRLLAEVERLRTENYGWGQVAAEERRTREIAQERYGNLLGEMNNLQVECHEERLAHEALMADMRVNQQRDQAVIASMRPIVEAVASPLAEVHKAVCRCLSPYDGPHHPGCIVGKARAFVAAHPAPAESEAQ